MTLTMSLTLFRSHSHHLTLTHTLSISYTLSLTHTLSLPLSRTLSLTHTHTLSLTHLFSLSLSLSLSDGWMVTPNDSDYTMSTTLTPHYLVIQNKVHIGTRSTHVRTYFSVRLMVLVMMRAMEDRKSVV